MRLLLLLLCLFSLESDVIQGKGYTPGPQAGGDFHVVLGDSPSGVQAFFFWRDLYLGTDALDPSARVRVGAVEGDTITLLYSLYTPEDKEPSGGEYPVRFHYFEHRLKALDGLPPAGLLEPLGRR